MSRALITGVSGQDGSYLAEYLLERNYEVLGGVRDTAMARNRLPESLHSNVELIAWDMLNESHMRDVIARTRPTEIYNLAACSSGAGMFDDPIEMAEINGLAVTRMLEAIRTVDAGIRFCQASSREIFGEAEHSPQTETTATNPRSPYGAAKLYADNMIRIYRKRYGMFACSAILFNHESPRRHLDFVSRKITHEAARIKLGLTQELQLGNLDTQRDWGFAGDYVRAMWLMLQHSVAADFVIATGAAHSVREFCDVAFSHLGLDYRHYVREDPEAYRPSEPVLLVGASDRARTELGWAPCVSFSELVHMMVDADMRNLSQSTQQAAEK